MKATITIEADEIGDDPDRRGMQNRYQFIYRARNEGDARKALAKDEATLKPGHLAAYRAYWTPPTGFLGKGALVVIFDYFAGEDDGPAWRL